MTSPTPASISQRLTTTSSLLLERSRILTLNLKPSPSSTSQIVRNLTSIRADLDQLDLEARGLSVGKGKGKGTGTGKHAQAVDEVEELAERYDRLLEMLGEDDVGREKSKTLRREKREPTPPPSPPQTSQPPVPAPISTSTPPDLPRLSIEPPTPGPNGRFRDFPEDEASTGKGYRDESDEEHDPHEMLSSQQAMMEDQDERLNLLSHSIGRQSHLSIQIGSELDIHHQLLEDTDVAMDRTAASLGRARRRLDRVADEAKQHGSTITIVALIFILLILIIVFKT